MRLSILDTGHAFGTRLLFAFIRTVSRQPTPEPLKLIAYRPEFFGTQMKAVTHEAMRGPSVWTVGDRELMAAFVSKMNECDYCIKAHSAVATRAYGDEAKVSAALADLDHAPIAEPLRATLRMLVKLLREGSVTEDDMGPLLAAGVSPEQVEDALAVAFAFDVTNTLAEAFGFTVPGPKAFEAGAAYLLSRGYR
jgi:uncharacterized peroxidase-related enzyme